MLLDELINAKNVAKQLIELNDDIEYWEEKVDSIEYEAESIRESGKKGLNIIYFGGLVVFIILCFLAGTEEKHFIGIYVIIYVLIATISTVIYMTKIEPIHAEEAIYFINNVALERKKSLLSSLDKLKEYVESEEYLRAVDFIPFDYFDLEAIEFFYNATVSKRVDSLKEAINLYEDYAYKTRMEDMQQQQVNMTRDSLKLQKEMRQGQQELLKELSDINIATKSAAKYAYNASRSARTGNLLNIVNIVQHHNTNKKLK